MDILKSNIVVGVSAALAATVLAPVLLPVFAAAGRPLAKSLIKGGLMFYEKSREAVAVAGESIEDMMAEIRAEEAMRAAADQAHPQAAAPQAQAGTEPGAVSERGAAGTQAPQAGIAAL